MEGISVVVCCYNSSQRIPETLSHLFVQKKIPIDKWEIIIVDNACTDDTTSIVSKLYDSFDGDKPVLKIVAEPQPGLSSARIKGIAEAKFNYVIFCDDDNWLAENYLSTALQIMSDNNEIAVLGGMGEPVFETEEPPYFWSNQYHLLAVGPQSNDGKNDITNSKKVVYGAGMVVNRIFFYQLLNDFNFEFQTSDRKGNSLLTSGDHELCLALRRIGYKIFWSEDLRFKHFIPASRTTINYYKKLLTGLGLSHPATLVYHLNKGNYKNYKFDYRYLLMRYTKNIAVNYLKLALKGYFFKKDKYEYIEDMQGFYSNYGAFIITFKTKNQFNNRFITTKLFSVG
jgi:glycosyltransferase involved in cell wall biosynthesis